MTTPSEAVRVAVQPEPIDMVLHCPACGLQHIDAPELGKVWSPMTHREHTFEAWGNPPHRSHLCRGCGHVWRPADVPTNGVAAVKTKGKADTALAALSLHVGDASDVQSDALGATPAGSGSTFQSPSATSTAIPGADPDIADIIAGALQTSRAHAYELMLGALNGRYGPSSVGAASDGDRWIPVTERLPGDEWIQAAVYRASDGEIDFAHWDSTEERFDSYIGDIGPDVTHWLPLPLPPSAQEQAGVAAQPSPHIEPAEYSDEWLLQRARKAQATIDSLPPDLRATFYAASATLPALPTTPTEGPAQPDLRGIDAGTLDEWKDLRMRGYVPKDALFLQVGDLPKVIARAIESKVRAGTLTDPEGAS